MLRRRVLLLVIAPIAIGVGGFFLFRYVSRPLLPPAERGRRIAEREGCFNCHGPEGSRGIANPGRPFPFVPNFEGDLMMYAEGDEEVREWIRDGVTEVKAESRSWQEERDAGTLTMPAFGERLGEGEIDDLVAFVNAVSGRPPVEDSLARHGWDRARELGCFGCHGPRGRLARPNPGSFKGYIPSWDGADFPELVRDAGEFSEWVESGIIDRFRDDPIARLFLDRSPIRMPAYRDHLEPGDVEAIWTYVGWLRSSATP